MAGSCMVLSSLYSAEVPLRNYRYSLTADLQCRGCGFNSELSLSNYMLLPIAF